MAGKTRTPIRAEQPGAKVDDKTAVLRLYDPIDDYGGYWGVSAKEFATALDELPDDVETIELHINSPGGIVFEGVAILNLLRQHKARYVAVVDGVAASAASFLAAGADELVMAPNSDLFVHRAWGLCVGNAEDMTQMAGELEHFDRNIASIYQAKAGGTVDEWLAAMSSETWYSAEEAVEAGLADRVDETAPDGAKAKASVDLSIFKNSGRPSPGPTGPRAEEGGSAMDPVQLRTSLGLAEDATDEQVGERLAALATAEERATTAEARVTELEATPKPPETPPLPDGVVAIDTAQLAELRTDAQAGRDARAEQLRAQREQMVHAAVTDGRIAPARCDHWVAQLEADPGAEAVLASLEKGLIPLAAKGTEAHDLDVADAEYEAIYGKQEVTT